MARRRSESDTPGDQGSSANEQRSQAAGIRAETTGRKILEQERDRLAKRNATKNAGSLAITASCGGGGDSSPIPAESHRGKSRERLLAMADDNVPPTDGERDAMAEPTSRFIRPMGNKFGSGK